MSKLIENNTIEKLEKNVWKEPEVFPSKLVEKVFQLRKKPIKELDGDEMRLLINQNVGINLIFGEVLNLISIDILYEASYYPGDLLHAVIKIPDEFWKGHKDYLNILLDVMKKTNIENTILKDEFDELDEDFKNDIQIFIKKAHRR